MSYRARAPSPTNTTYSGISNYRSESYRPVRERDVPAMPQIDTKRVAQSHFDELQSFLASHIAKETPGARAGAREKLTRLTRQQFQELSTDVYDELIRRKSNTESPHLANRDDFHPKRNQARQKLSTLPKARFKDLASDVFYELGRRYPEFKEPEIPGTPESTYEEFPGRADRGANNDRGPTPSNTLPNGRPSQDTYRTRSPDGLPTRLGPSGGANSTGPERRPTPDQQYGRRSEENRLFGRQPSQKSRADDAESMYSAPRRRPSNDTEGQYARKQLDPITPGPSTATSGVIIPNKSTIAEEEIQVPYGRDSGARESNIRDSVVTEGSGNGDDDRLGVSQKVIAPPTAKWDKSPITPLQGGLSALAAGLEKRDTAALSDDEESRFFENSTIGGRARSGSVSSSGTRKKMDIRGGVDREEMDKMRQDYEYRITSLQNKVGNLQEEVDKGLRLKREDDERIRELTNEISSMRSKHSEQAAALREAERQLADERAAKGRNESESRNAQEEIRRLQQRCDMLEREKNNVSAFGDSASIVEDLKAQMESLLEEVNELATRNEELLSSKDEDMSTIKELEQQAADYRKKFERAKTELRSLKATSQMFLQRPRTEDQLPTSPGGAILDSHITAWQSAADNLLSAGRSEAPSRVLSAVKGVVDAISAILEDARNYDLRLRPRTEQPVDDAMIDNLCERTQATLSNLVTASKTHATSYGLSPVSLLDAALSHVSASVTDLAKLLLVKRSPRELDDDMHNGTTNGRSGTLGVPTESFGRSNMMNRDPRFGGHSEQSSSISSSAPTVFDEPSRRRGPISEESPPSSAGKNDWNELKPYLDSQSEMLLQAIQGVLTSVRSPTPSNELDENLTQIITIVSSIVAVSRGSLPMSSQDRGLGILNILSEHCDKLSEVQLDGTVSKESRHTMAISSYAIANGVKELTKL